MSTTTVETQLTGTKAAEKERKDAATLDTNIRASILGIHHSTETLRLLIAQAKETANFLNLVEGGPFADWKAYVQSVMESVPTMHATVRLAFVELLVGEGMSVREMAKTLKTAKSQIQRDVAAARRVETKVLNDATGTTRTPQIDRAVTNVVTRANAALTKCVFDLASDSFPLRDKRVTDEHLTEFHAMLKQILSDVEAEQTRRVTERENAALVEQVKADPTQFKALLEAAQREAAKGRHPAGKTQGTNARTGQAA